MRLVRAVGTGLFAVVSAVSLGSSSGCGDDGGGSRFGSSSGDAGGNDSGGSSGGSSGGLFGDDGGVSSSSGGGTAGQCPAGAQCNVSCTGTATTSISGKVYDPALKNALYNVEVYVPGGPLEKLPAGVPTGADACSCGALFKSGAVVSTATGVDGSFRLVNAPVGSAVPLVLQIGKWRRAITVDTSKTPCADAPQPDKSLSLPGTLQGAGPDDNMPDIAVSTGLADTLECLMRRIGLPDSEYVAGTSTAGHIHVFAGGNTSTGFGAGGAGLPENPGLSGAPDSSTSLWDSSAHLMPYDILLLSCEGGETYDANPPALEAYLNAGGRAFASHFHYAWFSGPLLSKQSYSAPSDWGENLATWSIDGAGTGGLGAAAGVVDQTLNGSTQPFVKGQMLYQWLGLNGALGVHTTAHDLSIYQPRYNATVGASNKPSQPWITSGSNTMYFSFDTPVGGIASPDGGAPAYCGRAVFSDLHVAGDPTTSDTASPPGGCGTGDLSPQEKALEFMLFDLSSCVIPDTVAPPDGGTVLQ